LTSLAVRIIFIENIFATFQSFYFLTHLTGGIVIKKICVISLLFLFFASTAFAAISKPNTIDPAKDKEIRSRLGILQIPFIKNESQIKNSRVKYYANTFAGTVFVTDDGITYSLRGKSMEHVGASLAAPFVGARVRPEYRAENKDKEVVKGWVIKERLLNARKIKVVGIAKAETKVSYFKGKDQSTWKSNIPTYQEVGLGEVYDHIKLSLKAYGKNIEKLFIVEKGGKPDDIMIKVEGAKGVWINEEGEFEIKTGIGTVKMTRPLAYQEIDGKRVEVEVNYALRDPGSTLNYGFNVKDYNKDYPLIIDPLIASTFVGGGDSERADGLAIDSSGNVFIAGGTDSSNYPTISGAYDRSHNGNSDVFVSRLDKTLTTLLTSTFIGGSGDEWANGLAIDSSGNVFIAGTTDSSDYPTTPGAYDTLYDVNDVSGNAFVSKLNNTLTTLIASTFIGGVYNDYAADLKIDESGNVFVVGGTKSSADFPTTPGAYDRSYNGGYSDAFVSKLNNTLTTLMASTFIGGSDYDGENYALAIDTSGNVFIACGTRSSDFPTTLGAYDTSYNGGYADVFVSKLNNTLTTLMASTFVGGSGFETDSCNLAIDPSGNVFVAGDTDSSDYPTTSGAYDRSYNDNGDIFVSKLNNSLTTLMASTFIGGEQSDGSGHLAMDTSGNVFIAGWTSSTNFPTTSGAYDTSYNGNGDGFVSKLNNTLATLMASTFIGGSDYEWIGSLAIDSSGNVFVAGNTDSSDYPTTSLAYDTSNDNGDAFVSKLDTNLSSSGQSCTYSINPVSESFDANGATGSVTVTASPTNCSWTANSNSDWIAITSGSSGIGNGTVTYSVAENTSTTERTGTMTIAGQMFTVTQEGTSTSGCSTWSDVIGKYNAYVGGQAQWSDVINCYNQYATP
jgi:hypothetical protein